MSTEQGDRPTIFNVAMTTGGTEYSQALPVHTKRFTFQLRGANDCKLCYTALGSGTLYVTIKSGASYTEDNLSPVEEGYSKVLGSTNIITLYFQSAVNTQVAEIVVWK